jgi:hypothetical protein
MKSLLILIALSGLSTVAMADVDQTAGGWGLNCDSGNVVCTSGRNLDCNSTVPDSNYRSECSQQTGSVGWVYCATYDTAGNLLSSYTDSCP